ncbi:MAG: signal peptidase I [Candidatus Falkowbacteria bacterium]|nr:signal peptidase I [Candidatus Falkowbacteria bacterium]
MSTWFIKYLTITLKTIIIFIVSILFIRTFFLETGIVNGRSMENTFIDSDIFWIDKFTLLFRRPQRGDIVQFRNEADKKIVIKRVIGLPGEKINIESNRVFIINTNGDKTTLPEAYLKPGTETITPTGEAIIYSIIPENSYFLLGDNRSESFDSRYYGAINRKYINGIIHHF